MLVPHGLANEKGYRIPKLCASLLPVGCIGVFYGASFSLVTAMTEGTVTSYVVGKIHFLLESDWNSLLPSLTTD